MMTTFKTKSGLASIFQDNKGEVKVNLSRRSSHIDYIHLMRAFVGGHIVIYDEAIDVALKNKSLLNYIGEFDFSSLYGVKDVSGWRTEAKRFNASISKLLKIDDVRDINTKDFENIKFSIKELEKAFQ